MSAADEPMPADPLWSWQPTPEDHRDGVALAAGLLIFGGAGFFGGLVAAGIGSPESWFGLVAGTVFGLAIGGATILLGRRRDRRTWVALTRDGRLARHDLRKHHEIDLRANPTAYAVHLVSETTGPSGQGTRRFEYTLVGSGPAPRFRGIGSSPPTVKRAWLDGGIRILEGTEDGLLEAMSTFAEVVRIRGEIVERNKRVIKGFPG